MINPFRETNWRPQENDLRAFARSLLLGLPVLGALFGLLIWSSSQVWPRWTLWLGSSGVLLGLTGRFAPDSLRPLYLLWWALACTVGIIVSNTMLAAIYYLVITPIGLALRLGGRDALGRRWDRSADSYWISISKRPESADYFRPS